MNAVIRALKSGVPRWLAQPLAAARKVLPRRLLSFANRGFARFCPVCGSGSWYFAAWGWPPRKDAQCVHCGAVERHRLAWLFFERRTDLFDGRRKKVLHVAPEPCLEPRLRKRLQAGYLTADLTNPRAMLRMDVTAIETSDAFFDVIYCSHVLEHVRDDRKALSEFYRVLKPGGWAVLLVPIIAARTWEDPSIVDPLERLRAYGHVDHVRAYGPDFAERVRNAGFSVTVAAPEHLVSPFERELMGLPPAAGEVFFCTR